MAKLMNAKFNRFYWCYYFSRTYFAVIKRPLIS